MFTIGERVRAVGSPSLRRARDLLTTNLLLSDGREILLSRSAEPYWAEQSTVGPRASGTQTVDAAGENRGLFRVWSALPDGAGQQMHFPFTEAALAAREAWDLVNNFVERCEPGGMPGSCAIRIRSSSSTTAPQITLVSELYDLVRTIPHGPRRTARHGARVPRSATPPAAGTGTTRWS